MDLLDRIDRQIDETHLLKHPFYTKWAAGTLPREAMQDYARQYFAFESSFPRFLSALHSRTEDSSVRQRILDNLWDEEHGTENHAELWLKFAEGIGVARDDVKSAPRNEATQALVDLYREITTEAPVAEGVAAIYAYERQVPEVAPSKIDGLAKHYEITDGPALTFFKVHGVLDIEHSGEEREMLGELVASEQVDQDAVSATAQRALDAWWNFLSAVDMPATEAAAAN
jgi:pyrroloquinoline-quinone synthase